MSGAPFAIGEAAVAQSPRLATQSKTPPRRRTTAAVDRTLVPEPR